MPRDGAEALDAVAGAGELARQLAACTTPKQFAAELSYLLGGLLLESGIADGKDVVALVTGKRR